MNPDRSRLGVRSENWGIPKQNQDGIPIMGNGMKYGLAFVILGGLLGNMFITRRFKTYKGIRTPGFDGKASEAATKPFEHPSPRNHYKNDHISEKNYRANAGRPFVPASVIMGGGLDVNNHKLELEFMKKYKAWHSDGYKTKSNNSISNNRPKFTVGNRSGNESRISIGSGVEWSSYLNTLKLSPEFVPTREEIRRAYKTFAFLNHPDTKSNSNGEQASTEEFTAVHEAYRNLLKKVDQLEKRIGITNN